MPSPISKRQPDDCSLGKLRQSTFFFLQLRLHQCGHISTGRSHFEYNPTWYLWNKKRHVHGSPARQHKRRAHGYKKRFVSLEKHQRKDDAVFYLFACAGAHYGFGQDVGFLRSLPSKQPSFSSDFGRFHPLPRQHYDFDSLSIGRDGAIFLPLEHW